MSRGIGGTRAVLTMRGLMASAQGQQRKEFVSSSPRSRRRGLAHVKSDMGHKRRSLCKLGRCRASALVTQRG
jgi:hypothetical protein